MSIVNHQFILTDLAGNVFGELSTADQRKVNVPLLRVPTASFTLPLWHHLADNLLTADCLLKCYRTDHLGVRNLVFHGPVVGVEEAASTDGLSLAVSAVGPFWRLSKRIIGKSKAGIAFPASGERDLGLIAHDILDTTNGNEFTGISKGLWTPSISGATGVWYIKNVAEAIAGLTAGLNSFEFNVVPTEATNVGGAGGWPQIGTMDVAPFVGGVTRPNAIFEYGTPRGNVQGYSRSLSREGLVTNAWISVSGWPDGAIEGKDLRSAENSVARAYRGLYEEVVPDQGISDDGLRDKIVQYNVDIRGRPREIITFTQSMNIRPAPVTDFNLGDWVRVRAVIKDSIRFDVTVRVWGITYNVDVNGNETVELELVPASA